MDEKRGCFAMCRCLPGCRSRPKDLSGRSAFLSMARGGASRICLAGLRLYIAIEVRGIDRWAGHVSRSHGPADAKEAVAMVARKAEGGILEQGERCRW